MGRFTRGRCKNCKNYRPSLEYKDDKYCKIGLCNQGKIIYSRLREIKNYE